MTIVCAYTDGKNTWLGSDTVGVAHVGHSMVPSPAGPKWFRHDGWAFGHVGDAVVGTKIDAVVADILGHLSQSKYPAIEFGKRLRLLFDELRFQPFREDDSAPNWQNSGILACAGHIWDIDGCLSAAEMPAGALHARGCAMGIALGAGYAYLRARPEVSPEILIEVALDASARFDVQIRGKWQGRL